MRAAIYARVSTEEQAQSVEVQESDARRFAVARGWHVVEVYRDEGVSGADFVTRPAFLRMMRDLAGESRPWDVLVVRDLDRIGRDQARTVIAVERILKKDAKLWTYSNNREVTLTPLEKAMLGMQTVFSEFERAMIVGRVRGSHEHRARAGLVTGGTVYGYRNVRRPDGFVEYAVDPEQAEVVREVFARRGAGESIRALALDLNRRRVPSPSGGKRGTGSWSPGALHEILHRERYRGILEWGRTRKGYDADNRKVRETQEPADLVRVERPELALIDAPTWERARAQDTTARGRSGSKPAHLLTGFVVCAVCRGPLAICGTRRGTVSINAYGCAWSRDRGGSICAVKLRRPAEEIEGDVLAWMEREALAESTTAIVLEEMRAILADRASRPDETRGVLEQELSAVSRERDRLVRALAVAGDVEALALEMRARDERARAIRAELAAMPAEREALADWGSFEREALDVLADLRATLGRGLEGARKVLGILLRGTKLAARETLTGARRRYTLEGAVYLPPGDLSASPEGFGQSTRAAYPAVIPCGQRAA